MKIINKNIIAAGLLIGAAAVGTTSCSSWLDLKPLDEVAYVRFASVYREFKDVNTFMDELKKILK